MSDDPPQLTLASSNGEALPPTMKNKEDDWERERCLNGIEWHTRELAANMLRVMRGAGRPYDLIDQVMAIANGLKGAPSGVTVIDAHEAMWAALADGLRDELDDFDGGVDDIESGVVRAVAGRLVKQQTQASAGRSQMFDGIREVERIRERNRAEMAAVTRAMPRTRKKRVKVMSAISTGKIPPMPTSEQIKSVIAEPKTAPMRSPPSPQPEVEPEPKPVTTYDFMKINAKRIREGKEPI